MAWTILPSATRRLFAATAAAAPSLCRHLSTATRRGETRRAAEISWRSHSRRQWTYALTIGGAATFAVIALYSFNDQTLPYLTPTGAIAGFDPDGRRRIRLIGVIVEGSIAVPDPAVPEIEFVVTDRNKDILVRYSGLQPDRFFDGRFVVVEGVLLPIPPESPAPARDQVCFLKATDV